jgi:hypothetical protein
MLESFKDITCWVLGRGMIAGTFVIVVMTSKEEVW